MAENLAGIDALAKLLADGNISHRLVAEDDLVELPIRLGMHDCMLEVMWPKGGRVVQLQQRLPGTVTDEAFLETLVTINQLNAGLVMPGFVIDEDGVLAYRLALICDQDGAVASSQIKGCIATCIEVADSCLDDLAAVLTGGETGDGPDEDAAAAEPPWWAQDDGPGSPDSE